MGVRARVLILVRVVMVPEVEGLERGEVRQRRGQARRADGIDGVGTAELAGGK